MPGAYSKKQGYIKITAEARDALWAERRRTDIGPSALMKRMKSPPEKLTGKMLHNWFQDTQYAQIELLEFVMEAYSKLPDNEMAEPLHACENTSTKEGERFWLQRRTGGENTDLKARNNQSRRYIEITVQMRERLISELERTRAEVPNLFRELPASKRQSMSVKVSRWKSGTTQKTQIRDWELVLSRLSECPDAQPSD